MNIKETSIGYFKLTLNLRDVFKHYSPSLFFLSLSTLPLLLIEKPITQKVTTVLIILFSLFLGTFILQTKRLYFKKIKTELTPDYLIRAIEWTILDLKDFVISTSKSNSKIKNGHNEFDCWVIELGTDSFNNGTTLTILINKNTIYYNHICSLNTKTAIFNSNYVTNTLKKRIKQHTTRPKT